MVKSQFYPIIQNAIPHGVRHILKILKEDPNFGATITTMARSRVSRGVIETLLVPTGMLPCRTKLGFLLENHGVDRDFMGIPHFTVRLVGLLKETPNSWLQLLKSGMAPNQRMTALDGPIGLWIP